MPAATETDSVPFPELDDRARGAVTLDYLGDKEDGLLEVVLEGGGVREFVIEAIERADELVPTNIEWRIHFTGDLVRSVLELDADEAYTTTRGSNTVAGKTISQSDGSFDVLVSNINFWGVEPSSVDPAIAGPNIVRRVRHSLQHEALHVAIDARAEDTLSLWEAIYGLDPNEDVWTRHLGFMLEDYRIEITLAGREPNPYTKVSTMDSALDHFASERARSYEAGVGNGNLIAGRDAMIGAGVALTRDLVYLAGETNDPRPDLPAAALADWDRFVAPIWAEWVSILRQAKPATEPMTAAEITSIIRQLCVLVSKWLLSVGFKHVHVDGNEQVWWLAGFEW
ncbi:hypothetical protein [Cryobacterium zhongshanensis]|uniref:hypothetical protein n=1 Tax=Cryobacterium zhongshanensis TaxID=2928153 RepID=UPI001FAA49B5|nr:hypothetical protein [Cryobacterium zhongshanensis]